MTSPHNFGFMISEYVPQEDPTFPIYSRSGTMSEQELALTVLRNATELFEAWIRYPLNDILNESSKCEVVAVSQISSELLGAHAMIFIR